MSQYHIDERDMKFNLLECPGLEPLQKTGAFDECDADTLEMIFDQSKSFCQKVLAPLLMPTDRVGSVLRDGEVHVPDGVAEAWEQYKELGLIGMSSDSAYGGADLPHFFSAPVTEMECGSFVAFSMLPLLTRGAARLVLSFGSEQLKQTYIEKMFTGAWSGTMCLTEPGAGSDVGAGTTTAEPFGDAYKIKGTKIFISWGEHNLSENIIHLVLARIKGAPAGSKGLSLFVVPKYRVDGDGKVTGPNDVVCSNIEHKMGIKVSPTCVINFGTEDDTIGYLVGEPQGGIRAMFQMMNEARIEVGVQGMAQASAAYLSALEYAKERVQGAVRDGNGVHPAKIVEHEDVRRMLLEMRALVEGSRAMIYQLTQYLDLAHHGDEKEKYQGLADLITPICKSYGSDQGFRVTEMAIQTYGGYGYCQEYPVEQYMRDTKISSLYEGTNGIQAMDLLFRKILMDKGKNLRIWAGEAGALAKGCAGTELKDLAGSLGKAVETIVATVTAYGEMMGAGKDAAVRFYATKFQEAMGHVMVGYFLLRQARYAVEVLANGAEGDDATFYRQKVVTTRYFFEEIVPGAVAALTNMRRAEPTGLEAAFG